MEKNEGIWLIVLVIVLLFLHCKLWNIESKLFLSEDIIKEQLIGATFVDKNNSNKCVMINNQNIISFKYTVKPELDLAIGKQKGKGNHVCKVDFTLITKSREGEYEIKGRIWLRNYKYNERKWICEGISSKQYDFYHINRVSFQELMNGQ